MQRELIVSPAPGEVRAALLEDGVPVELKIERDQDASLLGALFLGRVLRVLPALPGAFIEIGIDRPAFLPGLPKAGGKLVEGAALLVQVTKDAFADKAHEVTAAPSK